MFTLAKQFGIDNLNQLKKAGNVFGVGDALAKQVEGSLENTRKDVQKWAEETWRMMTMKNQNIPVETGNLRDSISIDLSKAPKKAFVGVDLDKLKLGDEHQNTDYTGEADKANAEGRGHLRKEFIKAIWLEQARKIARDYGFPTSAVRLNDYGEKMLRITLTA